MWGAGGRVTYRSRRRGSGTLAGIGPHGMSTHHGVFDASVDALAIARDSDLAVEVVSVWALRACQRHGIVAHTA
jgi:hypothetical protein